ncbi:MAG: Tim44 domain-containing protein [Deltaproteobacteria bacterium]|nr:Tim44 domain-containing protein [Deltaproteobacteria bacterium]
MSRLLHRWWPILVALATVVLLLATAEDALARVGGGQNFSTGGGGGGGSFGGGGGGGDGLGLILWLILRLCIEYPAIGFPLLILFVLFLVFRSWMGRGRRSRGVYRTHEGGSASAPAPAPARRGTAGRKRLQERDSGFSMPVLQEYLELVHRRALEAVGTGDWSALRPFVDDTARNDLVRSCTGVTAISEVVHGGLRIEQVQVRGAWTTLSATFLGSRLEKTAKGERRVYFEEQWQFRRASDAVSLPPEETLRMGCPSCGAAIETDTMGRCGVCETPITKGQLQWQGIGMRQLVRRAIRPPQVGGFAGGDEPSVHLPSRLAPDLATAYRAFGARHPDFDATAFKERARAIFLALQQAWSHGAWARARPHCTDPMFQNLRFYMEQYLQAGLRNKLDDITLEKVELVKVDLDAWYESVTVRLWASMKDYVVDADDKVIGGNAKVQRRFSEYWTFLRAAGTGAGAKDVHHCPSCGAPLDKVSQVGICGYCESKITTGRFDWVLSRIDQAEVYQG